jgi:hypothetical protein
MSLWPGFAGGCFGLLALPLIGLLALAWFVLAVPVLVRPPRVPTRSAAAGPSSPRSWWS